jgi:hypothetical protein
MNFHRSLRVSFVTWVALGALTFAQAPKWGFLGGDDDVAGLCSESTNVVLICIVDTELVYEVGSRKLKPPFAQVIHHATVVQSHKGALKVGDRIKIGYVTDRLPMEESKRSGFIEAANKKAKGSLKYAFLGSGEGGEYFCEWLNLADYSEGLGRVIASKSPKIPTKAEQAGARQPATRPESKSDGGDKPQPESEGRSR